MGNLCGDTTDDCTAIARYVDRVRLIESAPIDLEAEVSSSRIGESRAGPEKEEANASRT